MDTSKITLMNLPPEVLLLILERLLKVDPITLLGSVPGVCRRMRVLCSRVHGKFNLLGSVPEECNIRFLVLTRGGKNPPLETAMRLFPYTTGLETFSRFVLHDATMKGHLDVVRRLLKEGADVNKSDLLNHTPLYAACQEDHPDVARLLLEHGADTDSPDRLGRTPLDVAREKGHTEIVTLLEETRE